MLIDTLAALLLSLPVAAAPAEAPQAAPAAASTAAPQAPQAAPKAEPAPRPKPGSQVAPEVRELVERMQAFYEKTQDFEARFKQDYRYQAFKRSQSSTGTVLYRKPALMRWDYDKPNARTFVLAGQKVYAYDPQAQTLSVAKVDTSQLSASVTFLFGQGRLADEFSIARGPCEPCKGVLLVLDPLKPDPRFRQVRLEVDPKTAQVLKSTVVDPDGSENTIAFTDLKTNVGVGAERFKINPPEGTRVDDLTQPQAAPGKK
jgi:outer membrane lipoprotein carrier protein